MARERIGHVSLHLRARPEPVNTTPARQPDLELRLMLAVTRRLPPIRGAGVLSCRLRRLYNRRARQPVHSRLRVAGFDFELDLDPGEDVDGNLLFHPQLYDCHELAFLKAHLPKGGTFVDVGANIGLYSLVAARQVGPAGRVVAIEADPDTHRTLATNCTSNALHQVRARCIGVSDRDETLRFAVNTSGNRGGSSFHHEAEARGVYLPCLPLQTILEEEGIQQIDAMKCDIEGFEYRVLKPFLANAPRTLWPRALVIESFGASHQSAHADPVQLLREHGYRLLRRVKQNHLMTFAR